MMVFSIICVYNGGVNPLLMECGLVRKFYNMYFYIYKERRAIKVINHTSCVECIFDECLFFINIIKAAPMAHIEYEYRYINRKCSVVFHVCVRESCGRFINCWFIYKYFIELTAIILK